MKTQSLNHSPAVAGLPTLAQKLRGDLCWDDQTRMLYATDASVYQQLPLAVAFPADEDDVQALIAFAREHRIGLIPRTAGTSLAGQVVGSGIVVDVARDWTEILEINAEAGWVRVQPGVIRDELNQALRPHGLLFGPETSTANRAMIGGMVGNNSCGSNSIVYGSTRDHTLSITGLLSDGTRATFEALTDSQIWQTVIAAPQSLKAQIYRQLIDLLSPAATQQRIRDEFPKPEIQRRNTGYAIDLLLDASPLNPTSDRPLDLCKLLAGSEGTLFFITEIKLNCVPLPPPVSGLQCAHFENVDQALKATSTAVQFDPYAVELIDRHIIEGAMRNRQQRANTRFIHGQPGAILITELRGHSESEVRQQADRLASALRSRQLGSTFPLLIGDETKQVWQLRKSGLGIVANLPGDAKPVAVIEDTAVAVSDLPDFIGQFNKILTRDFGIQCVHYGHAGSGEIHLRPVLNLKTETGKQQFRAVASRIASLVKQFGGSLSGEHGDGRLRGEFLQELIGAENYQLIQQIKTIWDPDNIFNPNKIIAAPPMDTGLRYQPGQPLADVQTVLDFSAQQGLQRAAELCSGSGDCRKTHLAGGTMCPSYMVTKNEADSTRGRANVLRQVLTNNADRAAPLNDPNLKSVMDLCLSCKGCQHECPSNVDVSKMKAEFLQAYHDVHGVPARSQRIAGFATQMKWASRLPWLYNALISNRVTGYWIKRFLGFASERQLPRLAPTTLADWFRNHRPHANAGKHGTVLLFCDEFTNFTDAPVGIAAVETLERLGWAVEIPDHVESGRAAMSQGMLHKARDFAETNVRKLSTLASDQRPLVGIEPSAILSFRDEYPVLVRPELRQQAEHLASHTWMFDEFFQHQLDAGLISKDPFKQTADSANPQIIRLHGHCHQKALASLKPTIQMLQLPPGNRVRLIASGCCGMAGSFGYEVEHYELSMKIGELVLFPTIRDEPQSSLIAAPGTSCRHQISAGTGIQAWHPIEIIRRCLDE